mmetsp:Transcript_51871/g.159849  ORF Transcript_51871/g.159849 Transcript_51871/m.159849 type:complete len:365 (-) Transcript_51871:103-1197(-)|eukprot:CAMPEP_0174831424 /NCGR_PEP_ID=MMETSP1114-20130205/3081_1 /TAXON_ID=312471 /ORGANISM="Neobodo designis, Strain CCAP 1951/1" /LENGTH=364 /DNA_ID=CAMNT_0016065247 /DNA_START=35 /DNA_END=1129 /DNA_ORIENTATION=-
MPPPASSGSRPQRRPGGGALAAQAKEGVKTTRALGGAQLTNRPAAQAVPSDRPARPGTKRLAEAPDPSAAPTMEQPRRPQPQQRLSSSASAGRRVVVILAKAGLKLGRDGLVDAYDRTINAASPTDGFLQPYRPDIVHQCLLALYDSDLGASGRLHVWIQTDKGKTIEVAPHLRPPRTYGRFKRIMEQVLETGSVINREDGKWLLRSTRWSIAPQVPHGAEVYGIHNAESSPVATAVELAKGAIAEPVPDTLQGGIKNVYGFYCISCTDDSNLEGLDFVTKTVCLSKFPTAPHVAALRLCEGFRVATSRATNEALTSATGAEAVNAQLSTALATPGLGQRKDAAVAKAQQQSRQQQQQEQPAQE